MPAMAVGLGRAGVRSLSKVVTSWQPIKLSTALNEVFPCDNLRVLDDRYRTKYGMSMVENLLQIQAKGMGQFLKKRRG